MIKSCVDCYFYEAILPGEGYQMLCKKKKSKHYNIDVRACEVANEKPCWDVYICHICGGEHKASDCPAPGIVERLEKVATEIVDDMKQAMENFKGFEDYTPNDTMDSFKYAYAGLDLCKPDTTQNCHECKHCSPHNEGMVCMDDECYYDDFKREDCGEFEECSEFDREETIDDRFKYIEEELADQDTVLWHIKKGDEPVKISNMEEIGAIVENSVVKSLETQMKINNRLGRRKLLIQIIVAAIIMGVMLGYRNHHQVLVWINLIMEYGGGMV